MLNEVDQEQYAEAFAPFMIGHAGQYVYPRRGAKCYHLKGQDTGEHLQTIAARMQRLMVELTLVDGQERAY